jgi:hypothetical protein
MAITLRQITMFPDDDDGERSGEDGQVTPAAGGSVYDLLARHQRIEDWPQRDRFCFLQEWAERFNCEFKLDVPEVVLSVGMLPLSRLAQFRYGHNDMGLKGEVAINARYLSGLNVWEVLGILLHELLHGWQQAHGTPGRGNHHNTEFREKAAALGLIVDRRGITGYAAHSPFKDLLRRHGIPVPDGEVAPRERRAKGDSKMKRWSCACPVNIRCAVKHLHAKCLDCGQEFRLAE